MEAGSLRSIVILSFRWLIIIGRRSKWKVGINERKLSIPWWQVRTGRTKIVEYESREIECRVSAYAALRELLIYFGQENI